MWDRIRPLTEADEGFVYTYNFTMALLKAIQTMQRGGFRVDKRGLAAERATMKTELARLQSDLDILAAPLFGAHLQPMLESYEVLVAERAELKATKTDAGKAAGKALTPRITKLRTRLRQWCRRLPSGKPDEWQFSLDVESSDKCCTYLYDWLGEKPLMKSRKGVSGRTRTRSADDEAMRSLGKPTSKRPALKEALLIQSIRERNKLISTYIDINYAFSTGRFHASFNPRGTWPGRYSSAKLFFTIGANQQNIPPRIRQYYLPDAPTKEP